MPDSPTISVVIPCRNEIGHIEDCLRSILAQDPPKGGFEIIVADGMSDDGTREILKRLEASNPNLRVIDNPGNIATKGLNTAIGLARGSVIVRMDCHTEYGSDYIRECLAVLEETGADNVGGPWIAKGAGYTGQAISWAFQNPFAIGGGRAHDPSYEGRLDTVYLGCWHREVFDRIGLFDEELVRSEDDEFSLRLTRAGGKIWQSSRVKSWYSPRKSLRALFRQCMHDGYWKVRVIQKHRLPASVRHLVPGGFVLSMVLFPLISLFYPPVAWAWLALAGTYLSLNILASCFSSALHGWKFLPVLPLVFACYHFGYGYGFLCGIRDFIILRRRPSRAFTALTRGPQKSSL